MSQSQQSGVVDPPSFGGIRPSYGGTRPSSGGLRAYPNNRGQLTILSKLTNVADPPSYGGNHEPRTMNYELFTSIENPTLAHFRHFIRRGGFSSLFTNLPAYKAADIYVPIRHYICRGPSTNQLFYAKQSQFPRHPNECKYLFKNGLWNIFPAGGAKNKPNSNPIQTQLPKG